TERVKRREADAKAEKSYSDSYNKDPECFSCMRALKAYEKSVGTKSDSLVVEPKSEFFQYFFFCPRVRHIYGCLGDSNPLFVS
ncbi:hypothetical protein QO218_22405, partial [Vibrio vulnificus]|nr:hypothetical protein [Vibrio vulnificus]